MTPVGTFAIIAWPQGLRKGPGRRHRISDGIAAGLKDDSQKPDAIILVGAEYIPRHSVGAFVVVPIRSDLHRWTDTLDAGRA